MSRVLLAALVAGLAAVTIAGVVVAGVSGASTGEPPKALSIDLNEWDLDTSASVVASGPIDLTQRNTGQLEHELLIVRTNRPADDLPLGLEGVKPSLAGKVVYGREHSHHNRKGGLKGQSHLQPDRTRRERIRFDAGSYALYCSITGHYQAGQYASLEVR